MTRFIELYGGDIKLSLEYASLVFERVINAKKHQHIEQIAKVCLDETRFTYIRTMKRYPLRHTCLFTVV